MVVRRVDSRISRRFKQRAVEKNLRLGKAITYAMEKWMKEDENEVKIDPQNLLKLEGLIKTKKQVRWSTDADEILYGWKK